MNEVILGGRRLRLNPGQMIGSGGEADVFDIGGERVLKLFKTPDHPDLSGQPEAQAAAKLRIDTHQRKLSAFPKDLPSRVIAPIDLATDRAGRIVGYTMPFLRATEVMLRYADKTFRQTVPNEEIGKIFHDLHVTVNAVHGRKVVIGDFNDLNVLVTGSEAYLIDADSMQFGGFDCLTFTTKFVDPMLCNPKLTSPMLVKRHTPNSDWYAYAVMLFQSLLLVDPYGGVYVPKDPTKRGVKHNERPLKRITVFDPEVRYPKPATPFRVLPDDLLHHFERVFIRDERGVFPLALVDSLRWTDCSSCGTRHARAKCPTCDTTAPASVKQTVAIRGTVTATTLFKTTGTILHADVQNGKLLWLYHEANEFRREDGARILAGGLDSAMSYRVQGTATFLAKQNQVAKLVEGHAPEIIFTDVYGARVPTLAVSERHVFWTENDALMRDGPNGPERVGATLSRQTLMWAGSNLGFGFYQAGAINMAFIWKTGALGVNDSIKLPRFQGKLVDATCRFSKDRVWFFATVQEGSRTINQCFVISEIGTVLASAQAEVGDGSWLSRIHGACAVGSALLVPTDDGVIRIEMNGTDLATTKTYPDTEPFVDAGDRLYATRDGLYVVSQREVTKLVIV